MSYHEDFPARVRAERKKRGWTQQDLADAAGVSLRTAQNFETRKGAPQAENLRAILVAVGIDPEGDDVATRTRSDWPVDVQVFLDMLGAYLVATYPDEDDRRGVEQDLTRQIFRANHNG